MKILLCSTPDTPIVEGSPKLFGEKAVGFNTVRPIGILRLIDWMDTNGYKSEVYDINNLRPSYDELIETFKKINPTVVGLSASLTHCYPSVKKITKILRDLFPNIWIVVGGHVVSSANVILEKTEADFCVVGDGEIPWVKLLDYFKINPKHDQFNYEELNKIKGLAFMDENNKFKLTGYADQLPASELKYPNYNTLRDAFQGEDVLVKDLFVPIKNHRFVKYTKFFEQNKDKVIAYIETAKGCVARCTFCQRYSKGYKPYDVSHLEKHIMELKEKYNVAGLDITDENFGSNKKQSYEVARIMKKCGVFWIVGAARCTSVTYEDLKFYKEHNLIYMRFGIESGSQKILDIMEKKFLAKDVYDAVSNCVKAGVLTEPDAIMAGMPGESEETIKESAKFMASLRYVVGKDWGLTPPAFWAMAIPGTPLYEYCQQIGLIGTSLDEEEEYLFRVSEMRANVLNYLNITEYSNQDVHYWNYLFEYEGKKNFLEFIIRDSKSLKDSISTIYKKCIKAEFENRYSTLKSFYKSGYSRKVGSHYEKLGGNKIKFFVWATQFLLINAFLSFSTLLFPRRILHPLIKMYARLRFKALEKKYRSKNGKEKYNFFMKKNTQPFKNLRVTEERLSKEERQINRSLRSITMANRKKMKAPVTDEEKGLALLAQGQ